VVGLGAARAGPGRWRDRRACRRSRGCPVTTAAVSRRGCR